MHPPLKRPHPLCQQVADALIACHEANPYQKYLGVCNESKYAVDACFKREKEDRRQANMAKAAARQARVDKIAAARAAMEEKKAKAATEKAGSS